MQLTLDVTDLDHKQRVLLCDIIMTLNKPCSGTCHASLTEPQRLATEQAADLAGPAPVEQSPAASVFEVLPQNPSPTSAPNLARSIAAAEVSMIAPGATMGNSSPETPANVFALHAAMPENGQANAAQASGNPAGVAEGAHDSKGMPWDGRIHSANKSTNADGSWRKKKGVDAALALAVEAELRAVTVPTSTVLTPEIQTSRTFTFTGQAWPFPAQDAAPVDTGVPPAVAMTGIMHRITAGLQKGFITPEIVQARLINLGIPGIPHLAVMLDKLPQVADAFKDIPA